MGSSCECQTDPNQHNRVRNNLRKVSTSDKEEEVNLKNLIQIRKAKVTKDYELDQPPIGRGTYGSVYRAYHRQSKVVRAIKRLQINHKTNNTLEEFLILKKLDHPNIIRIYDIYVEQFHINIVMDFCGGGELFQRIINDQKLTQNEVRNCMKQLLSATSECHACGVMHRDIKPENIMFLNEKSQQIKLIDFGVGCAYEEESFQTCKIGSLYYIAPEVLHKKYNQKCDVWSLGVVFFTMIAGEPPFNGADDQQIIEKVKVGKYSCKSQRWKKISKDAKDLLQKMLDVNHQTRISAREALQHPWIKKNRDKSADENLFMSGEQMQRFADFCSYNKFQKAIIYFISHNMMDNQSLTKLEEKFKAIDRNGDGKISWKQFKQIYMEHYINADEENIWDFFKKLDSNNSGFIDYSQFIVSSVGSDVLAAGQLIQKAFSIIDKNGDGFLSREELALALGSHGETIYRQVMKEFDSNSDGVISRKQFEKAMKKGLVVKAESFKKKTKQSQQIK